LLSVRDFTRRGRSCQAKDVDCYLRFKSGQFKVERWTPGRGAAKGSKVEKWTGCDRVSPKMESDMEQLHKRLSDEQVRLVFKHYGEGRLSRQEAQESLGIGKSHFFALLKSYRRDPEHFTIEYERPTPKKIGTKVEQAIRTELQREKKLVEDKRLPISSYNYSALRDRLQQKGMRVSLPTIIQRAKEQDCYREQKRHKPHDRQVVTTSIGALIQHDASTHLWSPYASEKWTLITSLDDYSRKLLYADFIDQETSWAHIQAAQSLMQTYGLPLKYYVDNLRVFRFVQNRDSVWRQHVLHTDEVDPQWRQVMRLMGVQVSYALSPQAKGKIERPYRWLQDRIVRTCALEHLSNFYDVRAVLRQEIDRYNNHQVHSTTGEIPSIRFENARQSGNTFFRPFSIPKPFSSAKDIFCLRQTRTVNAYHRVSIFNQEFEIPHVPWREDIELHLVPDFTHRALEVRCWSQQKMVHSFTLPLDPHLSTFQL